MSLTEQWDHELHRAEAVLEEDTHRFGRLHLVADDEAAPHKDEPEDGPDR
jgi:hypothetical protein